MELVPPPSPVERLQALELVEKEICSCILGAGQALAELNKDKPSAKQMEQHTAAFLKTLNHAEMEIAKQINYLTQVSTGQSHEGSSYAAQKVLQMAWHRTEHARSRVVELQQIKKNMILAQQERATAAATSTSVPTSTFSSVDVPPSSDLALTRSTPRPSSAASNP